MHWFSLIDLPEQANDMTGQPRGPLYQSVVRATSVTPFTGDGKWWATDWDDQLTSICAGVAAGEQHVSPGP